MDGFNLPSEMKALEYSAPRTPRVVEKRLPVIRKHELLIKVKACGVCGTDLHIHRGEFGAQFPIVPGHETVGVVAAFGSKVKGLSVGDRVVADNSELCGECFYCRRGAELFCENFIAHGVMVDGGFAEYAAYPARRVFPIKGISDVEGPCAAHGIDKIAPHMGSSVLLFGAGPTGLVLAQLLRLNGGCSVVMAAPEGVKMALAKSLDAADEYIDLPRDQTAAAAVLDKLQYDNPHGFDIVIEATGSAKVLERALDFVRKGGKLVVYGVYKDDDRIALPPNKIFKEEIHFPAAIDYLESGKVRVTGIVNRVFRVEEWEECLEARRTKRVIKAAIVFD
ncbi:zinc-dependent alcohol dehydrogenase family protein [Aspergillus foveolatus]|uniref:zinc-dependent alcohol dehydrogenase family protein n=1 Tax=Aspergillus foveolatus TaxID=210207 RepID=UPI003CCD6E12